MQKILKNTDIRKTIEMMRNGEEIVVPFRIKDYHNLCNLCARLRKLTFRIGTKRLPDATKVICIYNPLITKIK